jgi:hypothetical protein
MNKFDQILISGGDERQSMDGLINTYGCSPYPDPRMAYGFSTANTVSEQAYNYAYNKYLSHSKSGKNDNDFINDCYMSVWSSFIRNYKIESNFSKIFGPSGTDLELATLTDVLIKSKSNSLTNIILGVDEVGSGTSYIANGEYFSNISVFDHKVKKGNKIENFEKVSISTQFIDTRTTTGKLKEENELLDEIYQIASKAIKEKSRPLIHLVYKSKTGSINYEYKKLKKAMQQHKNKYDVVVDACQGRICGETLNYFLHDGSYVMLTGSKFFGGPPFSGILLFKNSFKKLDRSLAKGISKFFSYNEWKDDYVEKRANLGLALRWLAAEFEMNSYFNICLSKREEIFFIFDSTLSEYVKDSKIFEYALPFDETNKYVLNSHCSEKSNIHTLKIKHENSYLNFENAKKLYKLLYSYRYQHSDKFKDVNSVARSIFTGQPVRIPNKTNKDTGNIRLSLGAPLMSMLQSLTAAEIKDYFLNDFRAIEEKSEFILKELI